MSEWEPCCFIHSRRTDYCAEWDFVNDTTQEYARLDFFGLAPSDKPLFGNHVRETFYALREVK